MGVSGLWDIQKIHVWIFVLVIKIGEQLLNTYSESKTVNVKFRERERERLQEVKITAITYN